jgi:hypothetical protein
MNNQRNFFGRDDGPRRTRGITTYKFYANDSHDIISDQFSDDKIIKQATNSVPQKGTSCKRAKKKSGSVIENRPWGWKNEDGIYKPISIYLDTYVNAETRMNNQRNLKSLVYENQASNFLLI